MTSKKSWRVVPLWSLYVGDRFRFARQWYTIFATEGNNVYAYQRKTGPTLCFTDDCIEVGTFDSRWDLKDTWVPPVSSDEFATRFPYDA